jgi:hypothetical protein
VIHSAPHLITLSALASTLGGIVRPICFAAFRLMMNSNFVGCSTGRSAKSRPGDASGATDGPAQVLGRGDYLKLEFDSVKKRGHGAPKPPRVSGESMCFSE